MWIEEKYEKVINCKYSYNDYLKFLTNKIGICFSYKYLDYLFLYKSKKHEHINLNIINYYFKIIRFDDFKSRVYYICG